MCTTLYNNLDVEEQNEDEGIFTHGDDIAAQFYYGNFTDAAGMLRELNTTAKDFAEFIMDKADDYVSQPLELYNGHFSFGFWCDLGSELNQLQTPLEP